MKFKFRFILFIFLLVLITLPISSSSAQVPTVHAVLFYSPTCPYCHVVITEVLPPLADKYQDQLVIAGIDVSYEEGQTLYQSALATYQIPDERVGVPTLIIGGHVLVGSQEIPNLLPGIIEEGLLNDGIDWPNIPGLREALGIAEASSVDDFKETDLSMLDRFMLDPVANTVAVVLLVLMIISVIAVGYGFLADRQFRLMNWPVWGIPILALIGLGVALYLSYVEVTKTEAICGPVGKCNSVQESAYAYLFGLIPVGVLGAVGYIAILLAWIIQQYGPKSLKKISTLAIWAMAWFGIVFSIYLTFLEPFVIGATCAWCITSAIVMTLTLWASTGPAMQVMKIDDVDLDDLDIEEDDLQSQNDNIINHTNA